MYSLQLSFDSQNSLCDRVEFIEFRTRHITVNIFKKLFGKVPQSAFYLIDLRLVCFTDCDTFWEFSFFWNHARTIYYLILYWSSFCQHFYLSITLLMLSTIAKDPYFMHFLTLNGFCVTAVIQFTPSWQALTHYYCIVQKGLKTYGNC